MIGKQVDKVTRSWIRGPSDEAAIRELGARFDEERADHVCRFFETELRLYEGELAGQPFHLMDWQRELLSRMFGWVAWSDDWDREVRRFRKVSAWLPKKSGKSPIAGGVGLYLLAADGEPGQKVYSAAKDGKQAAIVHNHARQMVRMCPNLQPHCHINNGTGRIAYEPSSSVYDILSGDNIQGQEGLNGSVIIDETHVVDARLVKVLEYMGASRSEPMQFEVSTAGNNPEGYGKRQWNYGRMVERGEITDHHFLFCFYGVEPDITDEDCDDEDVWKKANPSWGTTIKPGEFRQAARRARSQGLDAWRTFCMYRLNRWLAGANPWLSSGDWEGAAEPFDLEDVCGLSCVAGLDLSKTRDMSALTVTFLDGELRRQKTYLWITEAYATMFRDRAPFEDWSEAGHLTIIPGQTIRQSWIKERLEVLQEETNLELLTYDKTYGSLFIEWLEEEHPNILTVEFPQSAAQMEGPIDDFAAALIEGTLKHDGNPCMRWQAGHCEVKPNARGQRVLIKPNSKNDVRKIDGMVASVMSLWASEQIESGTGPLVVFG
jgi:phage terminase large subunit-like protein